MKLRFSREAQHDLDDIYWSIAFERPDVANRIVLRILKKTEMLEVQPHLGAVEQRFGKDLRVTTSERYAIYYLIREPWVLIVRILHGSRDHGPLLKG